MDATLSADGNTLDVLYFVGLRMMGEREQWKRQPAATPPQ
jgi:hypothetical protein